MIRKILAFLSLFLLLNPIKVACQQVTLGTEFFGKASYYENKLYGRKTANGEILNKDELTCAHPTLPFGTMLEVTNLTNNKWCIVRVNDRGPFSKGRLMDLSHEAARKLKMFSSGVAKVKVMIVGEKDIIYIGRPDNMIDNSLELFEEPIKETVVPLKAVPKGKKKPQSKSVIKKRANRRKK